jgi:hypothetical protein
MSKWHVYTAFCFNICVAQKLIFNLSIFAQVNITNPVHVDWLAVLWKLLTKK